MGNSLQGEARQSEGPRAVPGAHRRRQIRNPSRAQPGTWRGLLWCLVIAADFFLMSNPLVVVAGMDRALTLAALNTALALVVTAPWVRAPSMDWPVLLFLGWLLLSCTWSIHPSSTAAAWAQTATIAAVAVAISGNVSARVLVAGVAAGGVAVSGASIYTFHERLPGAVNGLVGDEAMAGIGTNTNILAYTLTLSLCGVCATVPRHAWSRLAWLAAIGIIGYGLMEAESSTGDLTSAAIVATALLLAGYRPVTRRFIRTTSHRVTAVIATVAVATAGYVGVKGALGQDLFTFADRTPFWSAAIAVAQERPIGGFGYGAVWQHPWKLAPDNIVLAEIWDRSGAPLTHGHNSVIDLVVEVGFVGVFLMVLVMVAVGLRSISFRGVRGLDHVDDTIMARFTVLCLVSLVLFGMTEPMATIPLGWWVLGVLTQPSRRHASKGETPS